MTSVSLTANMVGITFPIDLIPDPFTLDNFATLFNKTMILRWLLNSVFVTTVGTLSTLITSSMAGYAFARGDFIGKAFWFTAFLGIFMVPLTARIVPLFIVMSKLGLVNTYWVLLMPQWASMFGTFMLRQAYLSIPRDYDDAALIDGATRFQIYYKILLPQITPSLATLAVLRFMGNWNSFLYPMIMTSRAHLRVLTVGLGTVAREGGDAGLEMAGAVVGFLPTFIVFLIGQRYVIQGIQMSGLKG
jgi:multiple sugar transport system permease protein